MSSYHELLLLLLSVAGVWLSCPVAIRAPSHSSTGE